MVKLGTVITYPKKTKKYVNNPKKYVNHVRNKFVILWPIIEILKVILIKVIVILMVPAK